MINKFLQKTETAEKIPARRHPRRTFVHGPQPPGQGSGRPRTAHQTQFCLTVRSSRAIIDIERRCQKRLRPIQISKRLAEKPSLGRVAVSAFYGDRDRQKQDVKGQCNRHGSTSFRRCDGTAPVAWQRLPLRAIVFYRIFLFL